MKNTAYSEWATHARTEWLASFGFTIKVLMQQNFSMVIFEDGTSYLEEIFQGEEIEIDLKIIDLKQNGSKFHIRHTFRRGGTVCANHDIKGAWIDLSARRVVAPPKEIVAAAAASLFPPDEYADMEMGMTRFSKHSSA